MSKPGNATTASICPGKVPTFSRIMLHPYLKEEAA